MRHERFPVKATKAPARVTPCIVVYYNTAGIYWGVERFFKVLSDGLIGLSHGREVARVSTRTVAVNIARRYGERHGVRVVIASAKAESWPRNRKGGA